jgi:hypothetical protein
MSESKPTSAPRVVPSDIQPVLQDWLVIPEFDQFATAVEGIVEATRSNKAGAVADYIPQLAQVDPELFGAAVCTIDGQRAAFGDSEAALLECCDLRARAGGARRGTC